MCLLDEIFCSIFHFWFLFSRQDDGNVTFSVQTVLLKQESRFFFFSCRTRWHVSIILNESENWPKSGILHLLLDHFFPKKWKVSLRGIDQEDLHVPFPDAPTHQLPEDETRAPAHCLLLLLLTICACASALSASLVQQYGIRAHAQCCSWELEPYQDGSGVVGTAVRKDTLCTNM